jgi:hypothetical protein
LKKGTANDGESRSSQFVALEYRAKDQNRSASLILIVLEDADGSLHFLIHPEWRRIVQTDELDYFQSLLRDFSERAELHPRDLMNQLSSLAVGPLVTYETGTNILDYPFLGEICSGFVQL